MTEGMEKREGAIQPEGLPEHDRTEEALRRSEEKYRFLFERSPAVNLVIDSGGRVRDITKSFADRLGYLKDEILGRQALEFVVTEQREKVAAVLEMAFRGEETPEIDVDVYAKNGSAHTIFFSPGQVVLKEEDQLTSVLFTGADITERKRMEDELKRYSTGLEKMVFERTKELRASERKYRSLVENVPDVVWISDQQAKTAFVSPNVERVYGYTPEEIYGGGHSLLRKAIHADDVERVEKAYAALFTRHEVFDVEYRFQRKDGEWIWLHDRATATYEKDGVLYADGVTWDVTQQKRMEKKFRESEQRFRGIAERSFDLIFTLDQEGRITYTSPVGERLFGYRLEEGLGKSFQEFMPEPQIPKVAQVFADVRKGNSVTGLEIELRRKDGSLASVEINASPIIRDGEFIGLQGIARDITERKRMEQKLRDSEERFRGIAERCVDGIFELDLEGRVTYVSPSVEPALGYKPEEVIGTRMEHYLPESEYPKIAPNMAALMNGMNVLGLQGEMLRKDGTHISAELNASPIFRDGKIVGVQGIVRDITERIKMENALREGEERYRRLLESMSEHIAVLDNEWRYLLANEALTRLIKIQREHLLGKKLMEVFPGIEKSPFFEAGERVMKYRKPATVTGEYTFADGRTSWFESHLYPVPEGIMYVAIDITERKRMEDALRISERRFRDLADLLPQIVFEIDNGGAVQFMNRAAFAATGCSEEDFRRGLNAFQMFAPEEHGRAMRGIQRTLTGETIGGREFTVLRRDGATFPVIVYTASIMREGKAVGLRGIAIDITERKRMEARLMESQRLAAIGETAAMVGHDLRNPLQATASTIYLARKLLKSPKAKRRKRVTGLLDTLDEQVYYMDKIVSDLQDYAGPLTAEPVETNLPDLIRDTLSTLRVPRTVKFSMVVRSGLSKTMVDPALMRRVLTNLVTNAIQAMPQGGGLTIRASKRRRSIVMTVQDTGEGIPREKMEKIFSPFFTTRAKGQGLGLAVCKRLVEVQGGTITVKSKVGEGSTFTVEIPARTKPGAT